MREVADMTQIDVQSIIDRLKAIKAWDKTVEPVSIEELRRAIEAQRAIAGRPKAEKIIHELLDTDLRLKGGSR